MKNISKFEGGIRVGFTSFLLTIWYTPQLPILSKFFGCAFFAMRDSVPIPATFAAVAAKYVLAAGLSASTYEN